MYIDVQCKFKRCVSNDLKKFGFATVDSSILLGSVNINFKMYLLDSRLVRQGNVKCLDVHLGAILRSDVCALYGYDFLVVFLIEDFLAVLRYLFGRLIYRHSDGLHFHCLQRTRLACFGRSSLRSVLFVPAGRAAMQPRLLSRRRSSQTGTLHRLCTRT